MLSINAIFPVILQTRAQMLSIGEEDGAMPSTEREGI